MQTSALSHQSVSINAGDTISWTNDDTAVHTTTGGSISTGTTGTFDSGLIQSGVQYEYTFDSAGTFDYFVRGSSMDVRHCFCKLEIYFPYLSFL